MKLLQHEVKYIFEF